MCHVLRLLQVCVRSDGADDAVRYQQPPPLPVKISQLRGNLYTQAPRGSLDNLSISSDNTHLRSSPRSEFNNSVLLSPNLLSKLKKIPRKSKLNAPLPYINLSKYDGEIDSNHVHIPANSTSAPDGRGCSCDCERSRSKGGYDNVPTERERDLNYENNRLSMSLPGSRENLRNLNSSDLPFPQRSRNSSLSSEPIYANERCETPPPELPPKGPHLKNRQRQSITAASRPPAPPRLPERQRATKTSSQYLNSQVQQNVSVNSSQEDYFMMGNFEKEPTHSKIDYSETHRRNNSYPGRQFVNLPPRDKNSTVSTPGDCYMDMTAIVEQCNKSMVVDPESSPRISPRPRYARSMSASGVIVNKINDSTGSLHRISPRPDSISVSAGNSPKEVRRETAIREENYMLMTTVKRQKPIVETLNALEEYVNASHIDASFMDQSSDESKGQTSFSHEKGEDCTKSDGGRVEKSEVYEAVPCVASLDMPFDNLIDFNQSNDKVVKTKGVQLNSSVSDSKTDGNKSEAKSESGKVEGGSSKSGFFSRLMRRNSKERRSVSQSHENLLSASTSEPVIKEDVSSENSSSGENSRAHSQQDLVFGPKDRNRSSSFPNRSSYIAMNTAESNSSSSTGISFLSQQSDLCATNSSLNSCETVSTHASSNEGNIHDTACTNSEPHLCDSGEVCKGSYEQQSYFFMGPLNKEQQGLEGDPMEKCDGGSVDDVSSCRMDDDDDNSEKGSAKFMPDHNDKVFTVLNVQGGNFDKNLCKTDDEKLIDLWHSTHSLNSDKSDKISELKSKMSLPLDEMSPDEKASAIARHISSLPPFVPPKMKSYPTKLSPVLEKSTPRGDKLDPLMIPRCTVSAELGESPVLSPSLMKLQAKATLRITPPSEDEHGKIWIPRTSQEPPKGNYDNKHKQKSINIQLLHHCLLAASDF